MCTNNTCNPEVDCPNENNCPSGSDCCGGSCDGTCNSTVPVQSVTVSPSAVTVGIGRWCHDLSAVVTPAEANQHVCWSSSDSYVASVNPDTGYVYGMREGTAEITATSCEDSSISDSCTVTVEPVLVESIALSDSMVEIDKGITYNMCATVCPEDADNKSLYWSSSDPNVATVGQDGVITGRSAGRTTIRVTATDGSGVFVECAVWVLVPVTSVELVLSSLDLRCGHDLPLIATVLPGDASDKRLRWHSDNSSIASVDAETGVVTGQTVGTTTIHATSLTNPENSDSCIVTVVPFTASSIDLTMRVGATLELQDMLLPSEAFTGTLSWTSSDDSVVAVDVNGRATAQRGGTTTISAMTEDGNFVATCTVTVQYCGGENYRDVTQHTLDLQEDGYYECTKCGYRVKAPFLQDKEILCNTDYFTVCALYYEFASLASPYPIFAEKMLAMVDAIRGLPENKEKYDYCDGNGQYVPEYNIAFGDIDMYINVNQGQCLSEWLAINISLSVVNALIPFPYSVMTSTAFDILLQENPEAQSFPAMEILTTFILDFVQDKSKTLKYAAKALSFILDFGDVMFPESGVLCAGADCYKVTIVLTANDGDSKFHSIAYHFPGDIETMERGSEYTLSYAPELDRIRAAYLDNVNDREYEVYFEEM